MMTLVFSGLSFILHLAHHFASFRRSFCKRFAAKRQGVPKKLPTFKLKYLTKSTKINGVFSETL